MQAGFCHRCLAAIPPLVKIILPVVEANPDYNCTKKTSVPGCALIGISLPAISPLLFAGPKNRYVEYIASNPHLVRHSNYYNFYQESGSPRTVLSRTSSFSDLLHIADHTKYLLG